MSFAEPGTVRSGSSLHSRVALALAFATVDSRTQQKVVAYGSTTQATRASDHDYVQDILNESATEWNELINHPFPSEMARGTAPLNGFRHYMIQDATYLEYYYRVRMEAVGKSGTFQEVKDFAAKLSSSLGYVTDARSDCTKKLGVPANVVTEEPKSQALQHSISLYEDVVKNGDWLDIHIVLLPCILGYDTIASKLLKGSETIRNTPYFPMWIQANAGGSSATKYRKFINDNIGSLSDEERKARWSGWVSNFKKACGTEKAFFDLGRSNNFPTYNIVEDGIYKILSYRSGNRYLVSDVPPSVTTQEADPSHNGLWILGNTPDGYIVERQGCFPPEIFLNVAVTHPIQPLYQAYASPEIQRWSINPVEVHGPNGPYQAYQLLVPHALQFALDTDGDANRSKVFVTNNAQISSQLWLLERQPWITPVFPM